MDSVITIHHPVSLSPPPSVLSLGICLAKRLGVQGLLPFAQLERRLCLGSTTRKSRNGACQMDVCGGSTPYDMEKHGKTMEFHHIYIHSFLHTCLFATEVEINWDRSWFERSPWIQDLPWWKSSPNLSSCLLVGFWPSKAGHKRKYLLVVKCGNWAPPNCRLVSQ